MLGTSPGGFLVLSIAQAPSSQLFALDLFLASSWGLDLACSLLGKPSGTSTLHHPILPLPPSRGFLTAGSAAIFMNIDLRSAVLDLTAAVRQLTVATQSLTTALQSSGTPGSCDSEFVILIISDSYKIPELEEVSALLASRTIEEGPPELPDCLKERAEERLFYISGDPSSRALLAFRLGFWAKLALDTNGAFECDTTASGSVISHWVVLKSAYKVPFRLDSFPDFRRFVPEPNSEIVYQTFQTICEVEIFCAGAKLPVPPLWRAGRPE